MRKELEQIIFNGELTDTIEVAGKRWTLRTISISEHLDAISKIDIANADTKSIIVLQKEFVIKSLQSVDGIIFNDEKERREFVEELPLGVVQTLYTKYDELTTKFNKTLTEEEVEEIKNSQKTDLAE